MKPSRSIPVDRLIALLPQSIYMDPPDGGDVSVLEQLQRMTLDAARYRRLRENWIKCEELNFAGRLVVIDAAVDAAIAKQKREEF